MGTREISNGECVTEVRPSRDHFERIPPVVRQLVSGFREGGWFSHIEPVPIPSKEEVVDLLERTRRVLFPGYFTELTLSPEKIEYHLGQELTSLYEKLSQQIASAIRHDCFRHNQHCTQCGERSFALAADFVESLPGLREILESDIKAALSGDPAAGNPDEIIFSYPGLYAVFVYRLAHRLVELGVPIIPRIMSEYAYSRTAIDIHPGARIGSSFFIDHGAGVVIGETTHIGNRVRLYQGVTLGALSLPRNVIRSLKRKKRHPTIEDDVIIYANASILGGETVVGARSIVGGNVWLTQSIDPDTKVVLKQPELIYIGKSKKRDSQ